MLAFLIKWIKTCVFFAATGPKTEKGSNVVIRYKRWFYSKHHSFCLDYISKKAIKAKSNIKREIGSGGFGPFFDVK